MKLISLLLAFAVSATASGLLLAQAPSAAQLPPAPKPDTPPKATPSAAPPEASMAREPGISVRVYQLEEGPQQLPELVVGQTANANFKKTRVELHGDADFGGLKDNFLTEISGFLNIQDAGRYEFQLNSDDGSIFALDGRTVIDHDGLHSEPDDKFGAAVLKSGEHAFVVRHFEGGGDQAVVLRWKPPGATAFTVVPDSAFTCPANEVRVTSPGPKKVATLNNWRRAGDVRPLTAVHPSLDLFTCRPKDFEPKVGGLDFLPDGRLILCTWDPSGSVYIIDGASGKDPDNIKVKRFASGLAEPLGIKVVGKRVFVLQKQELTELIDNDGDEVVDEYRAVAAGWNVSSNFHEFAFGLTFKDGYFYANLAIAINPGGSSTSPQVVGRGTTLKIGLDGSVQTFATGLRTPNGTGLGPDDELFITDNQGDWLPSSKLIHVKEGRFYGNHIKPDHFNATLPPSPPVVWLPQGEIGNSPSELAYLKTGPYQGQILVGDVTHGGLNRVFMEKVGGEYQGAVFQFTQGLEGGINRVRVGPDNALYVGGIGSSGNWGQEGKKSYGLQRLSWNNKTAFEPLAVRALANGFEIELTEPLATGVGEDPSDYFIQQWRYVPTASYGGPKVDVETLEVPGVRISQDRKKITLALNGLKAEHVVYLRLGQHLASNKDEPLWITEAWYTLNRIPTSPLASVETKPLNTLTAAEKAGGWKLLFDGTTTAGWRGYRQPDMPAGWQAVDGALTRVSGGGDIVTTEEFADFELAYDWQVGKGGNSGLYYRSSEKMSPGYVTGPEMQILDNARHPDGGNPLTSAGSAYAVFAPKVMAAKEAGEWNQARLVVRGNHVEHYLNGRKLLEYEFNSPEWKAAVAKSKFKNASHYGQEPTGHLVLQDHGDFVAFRNFKIREIR